MIMIIAYIPLGTTEPVEGSLTIPVPAKKRKTTAKQSNTDYDDLNFDNLRVPPPPGGPTGGRGAMCLGADSGSEDECTGGARPQQVSESTTCIIKIQ